MKDLNGKVLKVGDRVMFVPRTSKSITNNSGTISMIIPALLYNSRLFESDIVNIQRGARTIETVLIDYGLKNKKFWSSYQTIIQRTNKGDKARLFKQNDSLKNLGVVKRTPSRSRSS